MVTTTEYQENLNLVFTNHKLLPLRSYLASKYAVQTEDPYSQMMMVRAENINI
jgi:hypothetical protein